MAQLKSTFKDYFQILQVSPEAENEIITAAYYALMKKYHPDVSHNENSDKAKLINEAYEILSKPDSRDQYKLEYQDFKNNHIHTKTDHNSYISKRFDLKRKEEELKLKEEQLAELELKLKLKNRIFDELNKSSEKNREKIENLELADEFLIATQTKKLKDISEKIKLNITNKITIIKEILKNKLSLEQESFIYDIILDTRDPEVYPLIEGAFKFKQYYSRIIKYLIDENLTLCKNKIALIFSTLSFSNGLNSDILILLLEIYPKMFSKDELIEFLSQFQELITENSLSENLKTQIILKFLFIIKENQFINFFRPIIKKLKKEKDSLIKTMAENL